MRFAYSITFLFAISTCLFSQAQLIEGNVLDKDTKEPIPFANVFFSGTLIGTTTDLKGNFSFIIPQEGKYELIVSYVGYQEYSKQILSTEELPFFRIELNPELIELEDIQVDADTSGWKKNYPIFKMLFLGETENAAKVDINNPYNIFLFYDQIENGLFAHSRKEIQMENGALGLRIGYMMQKFRMEYRTGRFYSYGVVRFEEMEPRGRGQVKRWEKARRIAYKGSFSHFLRSFKQNTFLEEGFVVQELYRIPNTNRPPQSLIEEKLAKYRAEVSSSRVIEIGGANSDSLRYWMRMRRMPLVIDSLGKVLSDNSLVKNGSIAYRGYLKIIYTKEKEDPAYAKYRSGGGVDNKQTSIVNFTDFLPLYDNGYYDVEKVFFEGYFGWASKIAEMLPLEYVPEELN